MFADIIIMRLSLIIPLSFLFLLSACQNNKSTDIPIPEGGYDFPNTVRNKDTLLYFYPIKDILSTKDSFNLATYFEFLSKSFNEPNLSLTPAKKLVYRLIYQPDFSRYRAILTIQDRKMIIKELETGYAAPNMEREKLDSLEQKHLHLFEMYFPISKYEGKLWTRKYLDSMTKLYPKLVDVNYYRTLIIKGSTFGDEAFTYNEREIPLTNKKYNYFLNLINQSGYWNMKPIEHNCIGGSTHPNEYILEAATRNKYNFVHYLECSNDTSRFDKVIDELLKFSKVAEKEKEWHDKLLKTIDKN